MGYTLPPCRTSMALRTRHGENKQPTPTPQRRVRGAWGGGGGYFPAFGAIGLLDYQCHRLMVCWWWCLVVGLIFLGGAQACHLFWPFLALAF